MPFDHLHRFVSTALVDVPALKAHMAERHQDADASSDDPRQLAAEHQLAHTRPPDIVAALERRRSKGKA